MRRMQRPRSRIIVHVVSGANLNKYVHSIVLRDSIDGGLDWPEMATTINVDGDYPVTVWSDPTDSVLGRRVCRRD